MRPATSVPVTTVPKPFIEKARSIGRRAAPSAGRCRTCDTCPAIASRRASRPSPVAAETSITGADSRNEPLTSAATSSRTSARVSASARSALVSTTMPRGMRSRRQMSKCSRVCGITDSSAATISSTQSMPPTPASIVLTKRSWPGTSTNAIRVSPIAVCANPSSMVMPRAFSSLSRSGSMPVSALTSELFP